MLINFVPKILFLGTKNLTKLNSMKKNPKIENPVKYHSFRWTFINETKTPNFYKTESLLKIIKTISKTFIFQLESTTNDQNKQNVHYQGFIEVKQKTRPSTLGKTLNDSLFGIQFQHCVDQMALKKYVMKNETRIKGPWSSNPEECYLGNDLKQINSEMYHWQKICFDMLHFQPDDRIVTCILDIRGNVGKSKFCKLLTFKNLALTLNYAKTHDLLFLISENTDKTAFVFDLSKSKPQDASMTDLFAAVEQTKNGYIISTKFKPKCCVFEPPHVILFSNSVPSLYGISLDRWRFYTVSDKTKELFHLTVEEVFDISTEQKILEEKLHAKDKNEKITYSELLEILNSKVQTIIKYRNRCELNKKTGHIFH